MRTQDTLLIATFPLLFLGGRSIPASPHHFPYQQPDGFMTHLYIHGDESFNYETDRRGYTVIKDDQGWEVYAEKDNRTGLLKSSGLQVGKSNPRKFGLVKGILPERQVVDYTTNRYRFSGRRRNCDQSGCMRNLESNESLVSNGSLHNLVVLMRFSDHKSRKLPSKADYEKLMNSVGGDVILAPTGSVRDVYLESSSGKLEIDSTVYGWIDLPREERYYASGKTGLTSKFLEAIHEALDYLEADINFKFQKFDQNNDGKIDAITFVHSGFGAEWGGLDCDGSDKSDRIWSHHRPIIKRKWCSGENICVQRYMVSTGLWGRCSSSIGRIGVFAHELGHFLGLQDMYDGKEGGLGVGSYGLMGNCWGFDGSQLHPPNLDPWSRIRLGWITPRTISASGKYYLGASISTGEVYKIKEGYPEGEYLLLENRQPIGFERKIPQGGLVIWHVDEMADNIREGYPGQLGWPSNGHHYMIALVQADGNYHLEKGLDHGDRGDVWHAHGMDYLGPSENVLEGPFPNTDAYQGGMIFRTGIEIRNISESGNEMSFILGLPNSTFAPSYAPTDPAPSILSFQPSHVPILSPSASPTGPSSSSPSASFSSTPSYSPSKKVRTFINKRDKPILRIHSNHVRDKVNLGNEVLRIAAIGLLCAAFIIAGVTSAFMRRRGRQLKADVENENP